MSGIEKRLAKAEAARPERSIKDWTDEELQTRLDELVRDLIGKPDASREELDAAADKFWQQYKAGEWA